MANEIEIQYKTGEINVYFCIFNIAGLVYSIVAAGFVSWNNDDIDDYDYALTETGGGKFYGDFPAIAAGDYSVTAYQGTKISTDKFLDAGPIAWNGTTEEKLTPEQIADKVWDEPLTAASHNEPTSAGRRLRQLNLPVLLEGTSPNTAGTANTSTRIELDGDASSTAGMYDPGIICIYEGTGAGQSRQIFEYDGDNKYAYINRDWKVIPDNTSKYLIISNSGDTHVNEGLAQGGGASTITLNTLASPVDNVYNDQVVFIVAGTGADQAGLITGYIGSTKVATVEHAWPIAPDNTSIYAVLPSGGHSIGEIQAGIATEAKQDRAAQIQEGDEILDDTTDPALARRKTQIKGTSTVLLIKKLYQSDGVTPVTSAAQEIGREINEVVP